MIVCVCRAVGERQLRAVVERGACTLEAVERACGAGGDCGTCQPEIVALIVRHGQPAAARFSVVAPPAEGPRASE